MKNISILKFTCLFYLSTLLSCNLVFAEWTNGQAADIVLGRSDFTTTDAPAVTAASLLNPGGVCIDPTTGSLWIADFGENRVLMWSSTAKLISGSNATKVLGQPDFTSADSGTTSSKFKGPLSCAFDSYGNLYVSEMFNNRILFFESAATKTNGAAADKVFGQADFTSSFSNRGGATAANSLSQPWEVLVDLQGNLWVVDKNNHRVLRYDNPLAKSSGAAADFVLGQPDFTSGSANQGGAPSANTLDGPTALAVDRQATLFVTDSFNSRVLRWDSVYSKSNGAAANGVLGQNDFTATKSNRGKPVAANSLATDYLMGVSIDSFGGVYVSDGGNYRVLYFANGASKSNGADADNVLGQSDFITGGLQVVSATSLHNTILSAVFDKKQARIWVPDLTNNRVLSFYNDSLVATSLYTPVRNSNGGVSLIRVK